ncbi:hypothetical protein LguiA_026882 [Lonicera macranthoides]
MAIVRAQETSSSIRRYNYQVFLNFRGEDTRKTFTDHLYTAIVQAGLRTFRDDDEIERGKRLKLELHKAIQQSRISIIVLSKNYASSRWCLDEVVMILEWSRRSSSGHEVLPVFYDVDPSDLRNQKGSIGESFARYKEELIDTEIDDEKRKEGMEKLQRWKMALEEVANLTGLVLKNQGGGLEAKFIQEIVKVVKLKLDRPNLYVGRHLVGMQSRVKNIDLWVQDSSSSEDILVICGMGGIGKTTIAKFVYNLNAQRFEGNCFLGSVTEKSQQSNGLVNLQAQLLSSILKGKRKEISDVDEGIIKINEAMYCKRILVVIDNVDEVEQLDALLGKREFYPGSKIIITTRNKSLLKAHEVHRLHTVQELDFYESLELFSWHAFGKEHPDEGYMEQSKRAVHHCGGLPLGHKILGSSLAGKSAKVWASTLEKLEVIPETKILNVLKISFDTLEDDHDKKIFLHIACFFVGHNEAETIAILDACDFFTVCGIQNLVDRCLIYIEKDNKLDTDSKLMMHQLLQDMGRQIVDQESPNELGRRSRLWRPKDSFLVLKQKKGTETIEGLILDMQMYKDDAFNVKKWVYDEFWDSFFPSYEGNSFGKRYFNFLSSEPLSDVSFNYDDFSRMDKLRILKLNYANVSGRGNLVSLDMSYSKLEHVWAGNKVLLSLKILNLSHSQRLIKTPNFRGLTKLERLILKGCVSLVEVCDTIGNLERLVLLNLENCKSVKKFPNIGTLKSLQTLVLDGCSITIIQSLKKVDTNGATVNPLSSTRGDHVKLWHTLFQPWFLKPILRNPQTICVSLPHSLVSLSLQDCNLSDDDFPVDFGHLSLLHTLDLSYNNFFNLPRYIGSLRKLEHLNLNSCKNLHSISGLPKVIALEVVECRSLKSVTYQPASTKSYIRLDGSQKLREIQGMFKLKPIEKVSKKTLDDVGLGKMESIRNVQLSFTNNDTLSCSKVPIVENIHQGLYEFGIFSTFLRRGEIPSWCGDRNDNKRSSSSLSFVVPSHPSFRIRGLNVYSIYTLSNTREMGHHSVLFIKINNKTKDLKWIYSPLYIAIPEKENEEEELVWLSHWKFADDLVSGDEVDVLVFGGEGLEVKEFGINLVWGEEEEEEEEEEIKANMREVIGGDLSAYEFMSTRAFFISNRYIDAFILPEYTRTSWFQEINENHIEVHWAVEWWLGARELGGPTESSLSPWLFILSLARNHRMENCTADPVFIYNVPLLIGTYLLLVGMLHYVTDWEILTSCGTQTLTQRAGQA